MLTQKELFELLCARFETKDEAIAFIAEALCVSSEVAKKWVEGTIDIYYSDLQSLVRLFGLGPDELAKK
ncbi:hypothetical protein SAMN05660841_01680 [Sphingobacterium nematocida]|uniref:HTH cro/C1-type domain-containing protein n=1 Tax=Sphingobacterium nematocida TaxID=1513896 RepID=A0A1T5CZN9_9SPHI|nr:hypothetical protein [Sphingobacterium nematocida]SKB64806.1 hypothetical protein SAMN05660841_01680 [Sphingobacterium nematocida]